jgi:putative membrane protein
MNSILKATLSMTALIGIAGCHASADVENPNKSSTNITTSDRSSDYNSDSSVTVRDDTYHTSHGVNDWDNRNDKGPIMTDPIGRPSSPYRGDENARTASARLGTDNAVTGGEQNETTMRLNNRAESQSTSVQTSAAAGAGAGAAAGAGMAAGVASLSQQDRDFVTKAASAGKFEVRAAQLVKDRAASDDDKQFAQMMIDDHTKANDELKQIAQRKGLTVPQDLVPAHQQLYSELSSASDPVSVYRQQQVQAHEQAVQLFQDEASNGQDADLKAYAQKYLPVLQQHLDGARAHLQMSK